jgi:iron complex outermembrane receptor protein
MKVLAETLGSIMTTRFTKSLTGWVMATACLALTAGVRAADESGQGTSPSAGLEEIVVTAQRKSEDLQKAPVAVEVVSAADIARNGVTSPIELQELIPAIRYIAADQMTILVRGLGTVNVNPGVDAAVGYVEDGIFLSHPAALNPVLFDMQRVEAVLGPQGTLYGRNTNAGVINFISNNPTFDSVHGYGQLGVGSYTEISSEAAINLPINQEWALRISGGSEKHNAYDADGSNNENAGGARAKLLYVPTSDLSVLLSVDGSTNHSKGNTYGGICPPFTSAPGCAGYPYRPWTGILPSPSNYDNQTIFGASLDVDYDMGWGKLKSLTGFRSYRFGANFGPGWLDGVNQFEYLHNENDRFITQEVHISSEPSSYVSWVTGLFYSNDHQPADQQFNYFQTILQTLGLPPGYFEHLAIVSSRYASEAYFADATVPIIGGLSVRLGGRVTHETKDSTGTVNDGIIGVPGYPFGPPENNIGSESATKPTWKAGLDYELTAKNLLYATFSTGFKSGGVNNLPAVAGLSTYAPETIDAWQVGSKNRFLDDRLQVNAEFFHYAYKNYQTYLFYTPSGGPLAGSTLFPTVNSQTATFKGGEIDTVFKLTAVDQLGFSVNLLDNKYGDYVVDLPYSAVFNLSNTSAPLSPKETYQLGYEHIFSLPNGDTLSAQAISRYATYQLAQGNYDGNATYTQPGYHKSDANLVYHSDRVGVTVTGYIRNIENKAIINSIAGGYPTLDNINYTNAMIDPPRTFGLTVRKEF